MNIEQEDGVLHFREGEAGFSVEDSIHCSDKTARMEVIVNDFNSKEVWLDPLTVRIMIEQLQMIKKLQEGV